MLEWYYRQKMKTQIQKAFKNGELGISYSYGNNKGLIYPKVRSVSFDHENKVITFKFTIPTGMDPKEVKKKDYCFKQVFGENIEIKGDIKLFTLLVYASKLPSMLRYDSQRVLPTLEKKKLPVVSGVDLNGQFVTYDMVAYPHLLIAGETGSGKSTQLRSILTTMIQSIPPERLKLYLCDLKRSEFHIFRNVHHVRGPFVSPLEILPVLQKLKEEMQQRGDLLDQHEVAHVDDLPVQIPYIVLCIDEVALLKKEKQIMNIVEEISSIGRSLGIFLITSMQRPDREVLDGKLKNNLTVRMGFRCADAINSRIVGTPGSEKLKVDGRMLMKIPLFTDLREIQAPYLALDDAKKILEYYKTPKDKKPNTGHLKKNMKVEESEESIFGVLDE